MAKSKNLFVFCVSLLIGLVFWRLYVLVFYLDDKVSYLREITGLTIHHYHYGLLIVLFAALFLIFFRKNYFSIALMGFGLGTVFDSFISRLFKSFSRSEEIFNYYNVFPYTVLLFIGIIIFAVLFNLAGEKS